MSEPLANGGVSLVFVSRRSQALSLRAHQIKYTPLGIFYLVARELESPTGGVSVASGSAQGNLPLAAVLP